MPSVWVHLSFMLHLHPLSRLNTYAHTHTQNLSIILPVNQSCPQGCSLLKSLLTWSNLENMRFCHIDCNLLWWLIKLIWFGSKNKALALSWWNLPLCSVLPSKPWMHIQHMSSHQLFMVLACWILRENNLDRVFYRKKNCGQKQGWQTVNALGVIHSQHGCHHMITSSHLLYHFILIFFYFTFLLFSFCLSFYYLLDFPFIFVKHIELPLCMKCAI